MSKLLIKGGYVVDPARRFEQVCDILIDDGRIAKVSQDIDDQSTDLNVIDASGLVVTPGLVDMHVHLRDPGQVHKEDIYSGCESAAAGGFTAVACMPNTNPVADSHQVIEYILDKAKTAKARVYPVASITKELMGEEISDFIQLKHAGAVAVSDDGRPVRNSAMLQSALLLAQSAGMPLISHCEDLDIIDGGIMHKGTVSEELSVKGMDRTSEDSVTAREIAIAAATNTAVHIAHVSTRGSIELIRDAKRRGVRVSAETCPHYFSLTHEMLRTRDASFRMNPPLREEADRLAVIEALIDGTIDCIATDHAPHTDEEKSDFLTAPNGASGLETSLGVALTELYHTDEISLAWLIMLMSVNPCRILGINGATLEEGSRADVTIIDPKLEWVVDRNKLHSRSKNTPFEGRKLKGKAVYTICGGEITYKHGV